MKEFNINDNVKVRLTDRGRDIYFHQHDVLNQKYPELAIEPHYPEVDENGYTKFQLWCLIELYGNHINFAHKLPFETTILIDL